MRISLKFPLNSKTNASDPIENEVMPLMRDIA